MPAKRLDAVDPEPHVRPVLRGPASVSPAGPSSHVRAVLPTTTDCRCGGVVEEGMDSEYTCHPWFRELNVIVLGELPRRCNRTLMKNYWR